MLDRQYAGNFLATPTDEQVRQPRAIVMVNGMSVLWHDITLTTTTFYIADTYRIIIPLSGQPVGFTAGYLSLQAMFSISVYIGFPDNPDTYSQDDLQLVFVGDCDKMVIDPLRMTATFTGRDLSSRLIDTKTSNKYPSQTASNIAIQLAQKHNLTPVVTATSGNVGTLYDNSQALLSKETTEWDLLCYLAQQYNYVVYVINNNLYFTPKPAIQNTKPYVLQYQPPTKLYGTPIYNGMTLSMSRSLTVAKDVHVTVRVPYSTLSGFSAIAVAGKTNKSIKSSTAGIQNYVYTIPGLTQAQAQAKAMQLLKDISANELEINTSLPANNILQKSSLISVIGTNTKFDQYYYVSSIVRTMNVNEGYLMHVVAKNSDVSSQGTMVAATPMPSDMPVIDNWIDDLGNEIITNTGDTLVFNLS